MKFCGMPGAARHGCTTVSFLVMGMQISARFGSTLASRELVSNWMMNG